MRFAVKFLGCKVSQADAMLARRELLDRGHLEVAEDRAEVHVINTCCITSAAEAKSRQSVRRSLKDGPRDPERGLELGELMIEVAGLSGVERVRLSSVEVIHVKDTLLAALAGEPKVCPHLHVPLQSGDDGVLEAMGRTYTAAEYLRAIEAVRAAVPAVNVTADVIVGFPTEDDAAFGRTLDLIDAAGISRVHAFPYSSRPGTAAEALGDRVSPEEKKRRSRELRGRSEVRSRHHRVAKLGRCERVLVDKVADTQVSGYTADYTRCYLPAGTARAGELVDGLCVELHADGVRCRVP